MHPTFSGLRTFMRAPIVADPESSYAIVGVPYDDGTTNRSGARFGPSQIREMSLIFDADRDPQYPSRKVLNNIVDVGDIIVPKQTPHLYIEQHLDHLIKRNNTCLILGGDHSITYPSLKSHFKRWGKMAFVHFDAHADTWPMEGGLGHGNFLSYALNDGLIDPELSIQIGLRTEAPFTDISQVYAYDVDTWYEAIVNKFKEIRKSRVPTYLSFDIDVFDPAFAPGTGTPVSGGLNPREVYKLMLEMVGINWIGMDVVEVCPAYDHAGITSLAAATVISHFLQIIK